MKRAVSPILSCVFLSLVVVTPAFPQVVSGFATISVCDVPGTSQIIARGTHIAGEVGAEHPHFHTRVTVGGVLRQFTLASRCAADFNGVDIASCSASVTELNGQVACSTTGGGSCSSTYSAKTVPTHEPESEADNEGYVLSSCEGGDCVGDAGCSPFTGICF